MRNDSCPCNNATRAGHDRNRIASRGESTGPCGGLAVDFEHAAGRCDRCRQAQRETIHRRIVEWRQLYTADHVVDGDATERRVECNTLFRQRCGTCGDLGEGLCNTDHACGAPRIMASA